MRDDRARLGDMLEAIERIERYAARGSEAFEKDELLQTWVVHNIQVIGEAAGGVSPELVAAHPEVPWKEVTGIRHVLVHDYFVVDLEKVWSVVEDDLPQLKRQIAAIRAELAD